MKSYKYVIATGLFLLVVSIFFLPLQEANAEIKETPSAVMPKTLPQPLPPAKEASLELMAGQMIMVGFRGTEPAKTPVFDDIKTYYLGGIILFDRDKDSSIPTRNIISKTQLTKLVDALHMASAYPLFVSVDQEGGKVRRLKSKLGFLPLSSAQELGQNSIENTEQVAENISKELTEIGINMNFAPVVDVNINLESPAIGALGRSFSSDAKEVADHARAFLEGMEKENIIGCLKHFPGHGTATKDTHKGLTDITDTWQQEAELFPYHALINEGIVDMIMPGHLVNTDIDKKYPASLSKTTITSLLRDKLGFEGVVISDDLEMGAITEHYKMEEVILLAINAGVDILLYSNNGSVNYDPNIASKMHGTIIKMVKEGKISRKRLEESYTRICKLKEKLQP